MGPSGQPDPEARYVPVEEIVQFLKNLARDSGNQSPWSWISNTIRKPDSASSSHPFYQPTTHRLKWRCLSLRHLWWPWAAGTVLGSPVSPQTLPPSFLSSPIISDLSLLYPRHNDLFAKCALNAAPVCFLTPFTDATLLNVPWHFSVSSRDYSLSLPGGLWLLVSFCCSLHDSWCINSIFTRAGSWTTFLNLPYWRDGYKNWLEHGWICGFVDGQKDGRMNVYIYEGRRVEEFYLWRSTGWWCSRDPHLCTPRCMLVILTMESSRWENHPESNSLSIVLVNCPEMLEGVHLNTPHSRSFHSLLRSHSGQLL